MYEGVGAFITLLSAAINVGQTIVPLIFVFGLLVAFHEMGHYLAATACGMGTESFSIGMGPTLFSWRDKNNTTWKFGAIPIGGYIKLTGNEETMYGFSMLKRLTVVCAGPAASFLLAVLLYFTIFSFFGTPRATTKIIAVEKGSSAVAIGFLPNDRIIGISTENLKLTKKQLLQYESVMRSATEFSIAHIWKESSHLEHKFISAGKIQDILSENAVSNGISVFILRNEHIQSFEIPRNWKGNLGITLDTVFMKLSIAQSIYAATQTSFLMGKLIIMGLIQSITAAESQNLGGIIRIAKLSKEASSRGITVLLSFAASLSANLAIINMLPIPLLDGGRAVMYAVGGFMRPTTRRKVTKMFDFVGLIALAILFLLGIYNDIKHLYN